MYHRKIKQGKINKQVKTEKKSIMTPRGYNTYRRCTLTGALRIICRHMRCIYIHAKSKEPFLKATFVRSVAYDFLLYIFTWCIKILCIHIFICLYMYISLRARRITAGILSWYTIRQSARLPPDRYRSRRQRRPRRFHIYIHVY